MVSGLADELEGNAALTRRFRDPIQEFGSLQTAP